MTAASRTATAYLLAGGVPLLALWPLLGGHMPVSHDHPVHLYNAWHLWNEALLHGRLSAWDNNWFFGHPAHDLYPIGPYLWVALVRALSFASLSWEATYGLALATAMSLCGVAVLQLGRRLFGLAPALLASLFWSLDPGAPWEGGWSFTIVWGVWGQPLAAALLMLAMERLLSQLDGQGGGRSAAMLLCAAVFTHPLTIMLLGFFVPALLLVRWLGNAGELRRDLVRSLVWIAAGLALAAFWLLPFLLRSEYTSTNGRHWIELADIVDGVVRGRLLASSRAIVLLSLAGAVLAVVRRSWQGLWLSAVGFGLVICASSTAASLLTSVSELFEGVIYQRLLMSAKPCLFLLAGWAAWTGIEAAASSVRSIAKQREAVAARAVLQIAGGCVCAALVATTLLQNAAATATNATMLELDGRASWWQDREALRMWTVERRAQDSGFYRIAYQLDPHDHRLVDLPRFSGTPGYKVGYTPARYFRLAPGHAHPDLLKQLSARYLVSNRDVEELAEHQIERFGEFRVYELPYFSPQRWTLSGSAEVVERRFDDELIQLSVRNASPDAWITLHVADYSRWRATRDDKRIRIHRVRANHPRGRARLMKVKARDGELRLEYVRTKLDRAGITISVAAWLLLAGQALTARLRAR